MTEHSSTNEPLPDILDEQLAELTTELEAWIEEIGPKADEVIISCACGGCKKLTPRDILNQVKNREEEGLRYAKNWFALKERQAKKGESQ